MPVLVVVAYSVPDFSFLVHFYFAVEDEHSGSGLVVCLAAAAAEVVLPDFELVPDSEGLLVFAAGFYCLDSTIVGNLKWHGS